MMNDPKFSTHDLIIVGSYNLYKIAQLFTFNGYIITIMFIIALVSEFIEYAVRSNMGYAWF